MVTSHQTTGSPRAMNALVVREFFDLAFQQRRPGDAVARFMVPPPTSFSKAAPSPRTYAASVIGWVNTMPRLRVEVVRLVSEGDLIVVQSSFRPEPALPAMLVLDMFRIRDGKIVEHWDALQQTYENPVRLAVG